MPICSAVRWLLVAAYAGFIFYLSEQPQLPSTPGGDKTAHVVAYAVLGGLLAWALAPRWPAGWRTVAAALLAAAYGVFDEWHQSFVPGRDASGADMLADLVGSVFGAVAYSGWRRTAIQLYGGTEAVSNSRGAAGESSKEGT